MPPPNARKRAGKLNAYIGILKQQKISEDSQVEAVSVKDVDDEVLLVSQDSDCVDEVESSSVSDLINRLNTWINEICI